MRLYTTPAGEWSGTQADAKKLGAYMEYDVPTNKSGLMDFLNRHKVNEYTVRGYSEPLVESPQPTTAPVQPKELKGGSWDEYNAVRNHLETCDAKALNTALTIITGRLGDLLEGVK